MKRVLLLALIVAALCSTAPANAQWHRHNWHPPRQGCAEGAWRLHQYGECGWGTVPSLIHKVFTTGTVTASCIVWRESRNQPGAYNRSSGAAGLLQFMPPWWRGKWNPFDPLVNLEHGWAASRHGTSWGPWGGGC